MKSLLCAVVLGGLLVASTSFAAPSVENDEKARQEQASEQRGFQVFRDYLSVAFKRAVTLPRKNFTIVVTNIFVRNDLSKDTPFELVYLGTVIVEGDAPKDTYAIHVSSAHLRQAPDEYLRYTAAEITCRMVKRLTQGGTEERKIVSKCACEAVGREQCVVVHVHIARLQGNAPTPRTLDEMAAYLQTMENEVKKWYGIMVFERP